MPASSVMPLLMVRCHCRQVVLYHCINRCTRRTMSHMHAEYCQPLRER